jgi:hypothetical protein
MQVTYGEGGSRCADGRLFIPLVFVANVSMGRWASDV